MNETISKTLEALKKNRMDGYFAENKEEALKIALSLVEDGATVGIGGSVSIKEIGLMEHLRSGRYSFLDRYAASTREEMEEIFHKSFMTDVYFTSTNAVTENGELLNCDGTNNRITAMHYGPKNVILIVGKNKIVKNMTEAVYRLKTIAAPKNCQRLNKNTYCAKTGKCVAADKQGLDLLTAGCSSPDRICRSYIITAQQAVPGRIKIILVNEDLGY